MFSEIIVLLLAVRLFSIVCLGRLSARREHDVEMYDFCSSICIRSNMTSQRTVKEKENIFFFLKHVIIRITVHHVVS